MKPVIVFVNDEEVVSLTKEEFQKIVENVYSQGFTDGKNAGTVITTPYKWETPKWNDYILTCGGAPEVHL